MIDKNEPHAFLTAGLFRGVSAGCLYGLSRDHGGISCGKPESDPIHVPPTVERHGICGVPGCRSEVHEYPSGLAHADGPKGHEPVMGVEDPPGAPRPARGWYDLPMARWAWEGDARDTGR